MRDVMVQQAALTKKRIHAGVWEGVMILADTSAPPPRIEVLHQDALLGGVVMAPDPDRTGRYNVAVPIPVEVLTDGVQTFLIRDADTGVVLSKFVIVTGEPLEDDIRAEVELLRAELDMLKKAFRRHCVETS